MSSQQHTPEPWKVFTVYAHPEIRDADDGFIASLPVGYVITARRIVACVNACEGLPTEELEAYKGYQISSGLQLIVMKQQRDELLAALERMNRAYVNLMENGRDRIISLGGSCDLVDVMERNDPHLRDSRATIASVKGVAA